MLWQALSASSPPPVAVLQSARTPEELSFSTELRALAKAGRVKLLETVTRHAPVSWPGARGRINGGQLALLLDGRVEAVCFVCGPESLVRDVPRLLQDAGVEPPRIRTEQWSG
jgi:ferredoxin-NADP reductase